MRKTSKSWKEENAPLKKKVRKKPKTDIEEIEKKFRKDISGIKNIIRIGKNKIPVSNSVISFSEDKKRVSFWKFDKNENKYKFQTWTSSKKIDSIKKRIFTSQKELSKKKTDKLKKKSDSAALKAKESLFRFSIRHKIYKTRGKTKDGKKIESKVIVYNKEQGEALFQMRKGKKAAVQYDSKGKIKKLIDLKKKTEIVEVKNVDVKPS